MMSYTPSMIAAIGLVLLAGASDLDAQSSAARTRLRPLGSPSVVDQFRAGPSTPSRAVTATAASTVRLSSASTPTVRNETAYYQAGTTRDAASSQRVDRPVRQTVWMQSEFAAPPLGNSGMGLPDTAPNLGLPSNASGTPLPSVTPYPGASPQGGTAPQPGATLPQRPLPAPPLGSDQPITSPSDLTPMAAPQLEGQGFARVDNCHLVTPPSTYMAAMGDGCGQVVPTSYLTGGVCQTAPAPATLPAEIPSAATTPPFSVLPPQTSPPMAYPTSAAPARSLMTFGQERNAVQVGQGIIGQPVAYVPGQWLRNWLRYISP